MPRRGGLPLTYHWGGTDAVKVHLAVKSDWSLKPLYNVIAMLPGATKPDEWVVRGNHRDGWVFGASDPLTGHVAMMSEAKALGALARAGWRPERTIVYASWDGEEPGLLGSTEWAEAHADELERKAVIYINTDGNGRGFLGGGGQPCAPALRQQGGARRPRSADRRSACGAAAGECPCERLCGKRRGRLRTARSPRRKSGGDLPLGALGSGSDYSAFLQHLGIPSLNLGFGGEEAAAAVLSFGLRQLLPCHAVRRSRPAYGAALSKLVGRLVLRAADGARVPARYGDFAATVSRYVGEVKTLAANQREKDRALRDLTREDVFKLASNPDDPTIAPTADGVTPLIDMLALEDAADRLARSARAADAAVERLPTLSPAAQASTLALLRDIDQLLIDRAGLPGRPWYRNLVYAPGTLTGYGAKTLPGVREAIEQRRFADAATYVARTAAVLNAYADRLDAAANIGK